MRTTSYAVTLALGAATILGGYFLGRAGGPVIPVAMAQSGGACCGTPAPVTNVLIDGIKLARKDSVKDIDSSSGNAVCATTAVSTSGYRTLVVHVPHCKFPIVPEYSYGQAGFVNMAGLTCPATPTPGGRGSINVLDATLGSTFRLSTLPDAKGNCPADDYKVTVVGVR